MTHLKNKTIQLIIIEIFLTNAFFVGEGYTRIFEISGRDSWLSMLLGILLGISIIYFFHLVSENVNHNLSLYLKTQKVLKYFYYPILFLYYSILFAYPVIMIESLVNSYYLTYTNEFLIITPFILLALNLSLKGLKSIQKTTELAFPFLLIIIIIGYIGLCTQIKVDNYLPFLTTNNKDIFIGSLLFAIFSSSPHFLLINIKERLSIKVLGYILGSLLVIILTTLVTGVLGDFFMKLYSFPIYMAYKRINIYSFLQNLENILYIPGYFYAITLCSTSLSQIKKYNKKIPFVICFISLLIIGLLLSKDYALYLLISKLMPYTLFAFIIIFGPILFLLSRKKTRSI